MLHFSAPATAAVSVAGLKRRPLPAETRLPASGAAAVGCPAAARAESSGARAGGVGRAARWGWGGPRGRRAPSTPRAQSQPREIKLAALAPAGRPQRRRRRAAGGDLARGRGSAPRSPAARAPPPPPPLPPRPGRPAAVSRAAGGRRGAPVESSRWRVFPLPGEGWGARVGAAPRAACGPRAPSPLRPVPARLARAAQPLLRARKRAAGVTFYTVTCQSPEIKRANCALRAGAGGT